MDDKPCPVSQDKHPGGALVPEHAWGEGDL
jgi:hypothetical protein